MSLVRYTITPCNPEAHLFEMSCSVDDPDSDGQRFSLPAWIPGSYMIREFAKHVVSIRAEAKGRAVALEKLDKHTWRAAPGTCGPLTIIARIYAWDLSVRGAHLDRSHAFFNGTSVFLRAVGCETWPCLVDIRRPTGEGYREWRVATTLPVAKGLRGSARAWGFGLYRAADYDELIDHPVEMGRFALVSFKARGVLHDVAITGRHDCDLERLARDLKRVCESHIGLFGKRPPVDRYLFLVTAVGDGYGGLEHRASTALLCARDTLPAPGMEKPSEGYIGFLGLCSHEYFHTWNIKRIKPAEFVAYDLERENYTRLLWAFEGFTSYYDDLALVRSKVITPQAYLSLLAKTLTHVRRTPGRHRQSVAESSFDAWIKYYRQDENSPNAIVSYYAKGSLIACALDLSLRSKTAGRVGLDDVMRRLWNDFGKSGHGVREADIRRIAEELSGLKLSGLFRQAVHGMGDVPLETLLSKFGVMLKWQPSGKLPWLGVRTKAEGGELKLTHVLDDGPGQRAGLAAGDVLLALNGLRIQPANWDKLLNRCRPGTAVRLHVFRRDELQEAEVIPQTAPADECKLTLIEKPAAAARRLLRGWLGSSDA